MLCAYSLYPSLILLLPTLLQAHITAHTHLDDHDLPHPADTSCHPNPCPQTYQCFDSKPSEYRVYCKCRHASLLLPNTCIVYNVCIVYNSNCKFSLQLYFQAWFHWRRCELMSASPNSASTSSEESLHWSLWVQCTLQGGKQPL